MAKPKKPDAPAHKSLADAGLESFTVTTINRSDLKNADYNPRVMTDGERDKLKAALARHGLVAPITWNKRTGNIVGGHQRIGIMDSLMKSKSYQLQVAVIDVDDNRERELNVLLNNQSAAASWDMDGLRKLLEDPAITLEGVGFDQTDIIGMFGDGFFDQGRDQDLEKLAAKLGEVTEQYTGIQRKNQQKAATESYLVFVFPSGRHAQAFIDAVKLPDNRYQNGMVLLDKWGILVPEDEGEG